MVLANRGIPGGDLIFYTLISLFLSAGGSAVLNNVLDKDLDTLMDRLGKRVEAMKTVGNKQALILSIVLMVVALFISVYFINIINALLIVLAILSYTVLYTLYLKRSSPYGTIIGGLPGALPVLIGYSAIEPSLGIGAWILFVFMILWQPPHFWALALYRCRDYERAGVPMLPVVAGAQETRRQIWLYSLILVPLAITPVLIGLAGIVYGVVSAVLGAVFLYLAWKVRRITEGREADQAARQLFVFSILYLFLLFAVLLVEHAAARWII